MMRAPVSAEQLETLRDEAERCKDLPGPFRDIFVPAGVVLELILGYTPPKGGEPPEGLFAPLGEEPTDG